MSPINLVTSSPKPQNPKTPKPQNPLICVGWLIWLNSARLKSRSWEVSTKILRSADRSFSKLTESLFKLLSLALRAAKTFIVTKLHLPTWTRSWDMSACCQTEDWVSGKGDWSGKRIVGILTEWDKLVGVLHFLQVKPYLELKIKGKHSNSFPTNHCNIHHCHPFHTTP